MAQRKAWFREDDKRNRFLGAIRNGASVVQACDASGFKFATVDGWLREDEQIRLDIERAKEMAQVVEASKAQDKPVARDEKTGADRWRKMREDAAWFAPGMLGYLYAVEARLASRPGAHGFSPFWRERLADWYTSGKPVFLGCLGRGAGKSDTQTAVVVCECLFATRNVPPGETWMWVFASKDLSEANLKFGPLESALRGVGLGQNDLKIHRRKDGRSEIGFLDAANHSIEVRCYPNTKDALRGPTSAGGTNDEEPFWRADKELGTSSADEYLDAQAGSFRGDMTKKLMRIGSAGDVHAALMRDIEAGDTDLHFVARLGRFVHDAVAGFELVASRLVAEGKHDDARTIRQWAHGLTEDTPWIPSWVGNPTHDVWGGFLRLRKRVSKWLRENGSKPSDGGEEGDYFDQQTIDRAVVTSACMSRERGERFAAIDTGASKNPSALCIVERSMHVVAGERRYQFRPLVLKEWRRKPGGLPLDLRNVVLPEMARLVTSYGCVMRWWSDGWSGHDVENVGALFGIQTVFISTSTVTRDMYEPLDSALAIEPCPVTLSGCENIELAIAQLRQVRRGNDGKATVPHAGVEHGEFGQVLVRALAHAGIGAMPPGDELGWRSFGSDRDDRQARGSRYE